MMDSKIHIYNLEYYILLSFYLFQIICSVDLLINYNDLVKSDSYVFYYLCITMFVYFIFIIAFATVIINNLLYYSRYKALKQNDLTCIYILVTPELLLILIYFFFTPRFKNYKGDYMNNLTFNIYIIPKIIFAFIILILYVSFCLFLIIQLLDNCIWNNIIRNFVEYCRGNRRTIRNYRSDNNLNQRNDNRNDRNDRNGIV